MRKTMNILGFLFLAVLLPVGQSACAAGGGNRGEQKETALKISVRDICREGIRGRVSMQTVGDDLFILYPERDTLALKLLMLSPDSLGRLQPGTAAYLDRISYSPDVDAYFGEHLYRAGKDKHDIFYYDRQSESQNVLKHIQRTPGDDSWRIELIPAAGRLTAVLENSGALDLFLNQNNALLVQPAAPGLPDPPKILKEPFQTGETARILDGTAAAGCTVYDAFSGRLHRIRLQEESYDVEPLFAGGAVHYAALDGDGKLGILVYNPESSELLLFEESLPGEFNETAVTLCRDTTSVFFFAVDGRRMFVFNETTLDRKSNTRYRLSLLYPDRTGKYGKKALYEDEQPIRSFQAVFLDKCLHVSFVQESLRLLSLCFSESDSVEDQDP